MPEIGTSGLMSGVGKQGGAQRQYLRPTSTLPNATYFVVQSFFLGCLSQGKGRHLGWTFVALWDSLIMRGVHHPFCESTNVGSATGIWWSDFFRGGTGVDL